MELRSFQDMVSLYGFDEAEQEMLALLMEPECLAMLGYAGDGGSGAGES